MVRTWCATIDRAERGEPGTIGPRKAEVSWLAPRSPVLSTSFTRFQILRQLAIDSNQ